MTTAGHVPHLKAREAIPNLFLKLEQVPPSDVLFCSSSRDLETSWVEKPKHFFQECEEDNEIESDSESEYSPSESSHESDYEISDTDEEEQNASSSTLYPDADMSK